MMGTVVQPGRPASIPVDLARLLDAHDERIDLIANGLVVGFNANEITARLLRVGPEGYNLLPHLAQQPHERRLHEQIETVPFRKPEKVGQGQKLDRKVGRLFRNLIEVNMPESDPITRQDAGKRETDL
jgi:hypothetical protein